MTYSSDIQEEMFDYFQMNYKSIFGKYLPEEEVRELALAALSNKSSQQQEFDLRLNNYVNDFSQQNFDMQPYLKDWDINYIESLRETYGGVILALFHYGAHRHVLVDLVSLNVDCVAPVAGKAYDDLQKLLAHSSTEIAEKVALLEVEDDKVSRTLLDSLKKGNVGGIYVDGNMGPTSRNSNKGCVKVDYFDYAISVKAGISRLSIMLKLPILPVFSSPSVHSPEIQFGGLIHPAHYVEKYSKKLAPKYMMQTLYSLLEEKVRLEPSHWEFALCLHRWVQHPLMANNQKANISLNNIKRLRVNTKAVSVMELNGKLYWINTQLAKGFSIPDSLISIFKRFYTLKVISLAAFEELLAKQNYDLAPILDQLVLNKLVQVD
jgi:lauroyl/myristoyl acyltransferase